MAFDSVADPSASVRVPRDFTDAVTRYQALVYTICFKLTGHSSDAEDLTQDTFVKAFRAWDGFSDGDRKAWLCKIALHTALDHVKQKTREPARAGGGDWEEFLAVLPARENVEATAERREDFRRLEELLGRMPEKYASALTRAAVHGMGVREIAAQDHVPEKTVETRLYRARKILRERWEKG